MAAPSNRMSNSIHDLEWLYWMGQGTLRPFGRRLLSYSDWHTIGANFGNLVRRLEALEQLLQDELCDCSRSTDDVPLDPHSPSTHDFSCPYRRKWNEALEQPSDKRT
jgi:hypothetical protein